MIYLKAVLVGLATTAIGLPLLVLVLVLVLHYRMSGDQTGLHAIASGFYELCRAALIFFVLGSVGYLLLKK